MFSQTDIAFNFYFLSRLRIKYASINDCTMCKVVTVVILEPLNLFALIIAFWFQSDQYTESSNVDMLNGWGSQMGLNNTKRRWLPSKLHDEMVWSFASTQYNRLDTKSRVRPLGHFTSNEAITSRCVPSMPARSILALLPQSLQYNHLKFKKRETRGVKR